MQPPEEIQEADKEYFNNLIERFEQIWYNCYQGRDLGISKSAAFTAFIQVDQTFKLIDYFDNDETIAPRRDDDDEGDEWKTK
jgi:hypothetical protein